MWFIIMKKAKNKHVRSSEFVESAISEGSDCSMARISTVQKHEEKDKVFCVSEISEILKYSIEQDFCSIRIKGEISGLKIATSGHSYFTLKDDKSVIHSICWKGVKLTVKLEDGLEVICSGGLTIYAGRSVYQLIVRSIEVSGIGALLALFEKRKQKFTAAGLFNSERKRLLPFLPQVIGIITSVKGAVIRDILHRISARFPCHVIIWDVLVQGQDAAVQISNALRGFNALDDCIAKPDLLIIARGGGALEDLWAFNEEEIVYAISESHIPVISAIGHETDTTLADMVADVRAPTPTAAAEFAVPVIGDLQQKIARQKNNIKLALLNLLRIKFCRVTNLDASFFKITENIRKKATFLDEQSSSLHNAIKHLIGIKMHQVATFSNRNITLHINNHFNVKKQVLSSLNRAYDNAVRKYCDIQKHKLHYYAKLLISYSYRRVLQRGFVVVRSNDDKRVISNTMALTKGSKVVLEFYDGCKIVEVVE